MSQNKHCPFCGSPNEVDNDFCSNCGASLTETPSYDTPATTPGYPTSSEPSQQYGGSYSQQPGTYTTSTTYQQPRSSSSSSNGTIALILSILSCVGILPCIGAIIGLVLGTQAKKEGDSNGNIAVILGWLSICAYIAGILIYVIIFFFSGFYYL